MNPHGIAASAPAIERERTCCWASRPAAAKPTSRCRTSRPPVRSTGGHVGVYGVKTWGALLRRGRRRTTRASTTRPPAPSSAVGPTEIANGKFRQRSAQRAASNSAGSTHSRSYTLTPFVAIEPAALWAHGYTETSTSVGGRRRHPRPELRGAHHHVAADVPRACRSTPARSSATASIADALCARARGCTNSSPTGRSTATFISIPAATFTVDGARAASDAARIDAGVKLRARLDAIVLHQPERRMVERRPEHLGDRRVQADPLGRSDAKRNTARRWRTASSR